MLKTASGFKVYLFVAQKIMHLIKKNQNNIEEFSDQE